jgi:hypothetical protein
MISKERLGLAGLLLLPLFSSCGGASLANPEHEQTQPEGDSDAALLDRLNAAARRGAVSETLHGVTVTDPYRSLETDSPETRAWITAQTERARGMLDEWTEPEAAARLDTLLSIGVIGGVHAAGETLFYT